MTAYRLVFKKRELEYICVALLLFFQIYLQNIIYPFQYLDELVTVFFLMKIALHGIKNKLTKFDISLLVNILLIVFVGILSNIIAGVQLGWKPILTDMGNTFKVFIVYWGAKEILSKGVNKKRIVSTLACFVNVFVWIAFVCLILHELHIISMGNDVRYGMRSFRFINYNAGQLSMMFYYIMLVLTLDASWKTRKLSISTVMALIVWCSTLRSRAFMYCAIYLFLYWIIIKQKQKLEFSLKTIVPTVGILYLFAVDQFETYFSNTATARSNLLRYGIETMKRFFPLGSGFATYGTDAAAKYYSKLYVKYGFDHVYGLSRDNTMFARDTYWPAIAAQFGIVGFILMVLLLWKLFKDILKQAKGDPYSYFLALFICITQVSSSIATATFFHFVTVALFFVVPLIFPVASVEKGK